ncbi:unnamed protein product, partial [Rotaria socialis]
MLVREEPWFSMAPPSSIQQFNSIQFNPNEHKS